MLRRPVRVHEVGAQVLHRELLRVEGDWFRAEGAPFEGCQIKVAELASGAGDDELPEILIYIINGKGYWVNIFNTIHNIGRTTQVKVWIAGLLLAYR